MGRVYHCVWLFIKVKYYKLVSFDLKIEFINRDSLNFSHSIKNNYFPIRIRVDLNS